MLITLLAWFYITFLCWSWGNILIDLFKRITRSGFEPPHFSIVCLFGLSLITTIAGWLSLFTPLGNWWIQLVFILPALFFLVNKRNVLYFSLIKLRASELQLASFLFLASCLLLILVMCTWKIVHPDTLSYHAQTIQWIEKYKAVPGLVHLHSRFGYQGFWFVDNGLFGFSFTGIDGTTFLNSIVLAWFLFFITTRIDHNLFKQGKNIIGILWLLFLALTIYSYTQVRLTATSASPDFIATLYVLTIVYLLVGKTLQHLPVTDWFLIVFLSLVAITIKLSVAPIILIAVMALLIMIIRRRSVRFSLTIFLILILVLTPFIARNIITSGYPIFPSAIFDVAKVDWKYSKELTINEKDYITAYAKKQGVVTREEINYLNQMKVTEWLPVWWQQRSIADKIIILLLILSFIAGLLFLKKVLSAGFIPILVFATMLIGICFWLVNAPDPRFGFGSIFGFIGAVSYIIFKEKEIVIGKNVLLAILSVATLLILTYTGYRIRNFFNSDQLVRPLGIEKNEYHTLECDGMKVNSPVLGDDFGNTPVPCTNLSCEKFSPRGKKIEDGFRSK